MSEPTAQTRPERDAAAAKRPAGKERKRSVKDWTERLEVRRAVVAGAARIAGWTPETELSEAAFAAGIAAFEKKPLGGPRNAPAHSGKVVPSHEVSK